MEIMINLVNNFTPYVKDKYNRLQMLLYCNNLAAHVSNTAKSTI